MLHLRVAVCGRRRARSRSLCVAYTLDECRVVFFTRFFSSFWFVSLFFRPHAIRIFIFLIHPSIALLSLLQRKHSFAHTIGLSLIVTLPTAASVRYQRTYEPPQCSYIIPPVSVVAPRHYHYILGGTYNRRASFFSFRNVLFNSIYGRFTYRRCIYRLFYIFKSNLFCVDTSAPQKEALDKY